jgi:hypothetical protein
MRARHIPRPDGRTYCGRSVRWRRDDPAGIRKAYESEENREGACMPCVARLRAEERRVTQDMEDASLEELEAAADVLDRARRDER